MLTHAKYSRCCASTAVRSANVPIQTVPNARFRQRAHQRSTYDAKTSRLINSGTIEVFVITVPESNVADILAQRAKARTGARIIVRAQHIADIEELYANGASVVVVPEPAETIEQELTTARRSAVSSVGRGSF